MKELKKIEKGIAGYPDLWSELLNRRKKIDEEKENDVIINEGEISYELEDRADELTINFIEFFKTRYDDDFVKLMEKDVVATLPIFIQFFSRLFADLVFLEAYKGVGNPEKATEHAIQARGIDYASFEMRQVFEIIKRFIEVGDSIESRKTRTILKKHLN